MDSFMSAIGLKRVCLIEDDATLALLLRYNIEASGATVDWLADGTEALAYLRTERPDAIVLDWELPGLSGIEILRQVRAAQRFREIPVLMLTARTDPRDRARAINLGADAFIEKPFSVRELLGLLRDRLECGDREHDERAMVVEP